MVPLLLSLVTLHPTCWRALLVFLFLSHTGHTLFHVLITLRYSDKPLISEGWMIISECAWVKYSHSLAVVGYKVYQLNLHLIWLDISLVLKILCFFNNTSTHWLLFECPISEGWMPRLLLWLPLLFICHVPFCKCHISVSDSCMLLLPRPPLLRKFLTWVRSNIPRFQ